VSRVPIRLRVAAAFALAMAVVLAGTGWFLYARLGSHLEGALDGELRVRAQDLAALVREPDGSLAAAGGARLVERGESYAQLIDANGNVVDSTQPLGRVPLLSTRELLSVRRATLVADRHSVPGLDEPSRLLATQIERGGRRFVLVVGVTRQDRAETLASLREELLIAGPIALVLASVAGYLLAGLALRPVESMRRRAATISAETRGERLPVPTTRDEIERLGGTLNAMLERLEDALQRERDFVADAGHELRTPLALLRTELELALRHGESAGELRDAIRRSSEEVDRLAQLAEDLLLIARSDRGRLRLQVETLDVSTLLAAVATRFSWRADDAGRTVTVKAPPGLSVEADRLRVEQALGNLVDNALRHGNGTVTISATETDGTVLLQVGDEGAGFPEGFVARAFERFSRPDQSRASPGSGLGLSIVKTIVEAHGGTARATNSAAGGFEVALRLPSAASRSSRVHASESTSASIDPKGGQL
jgi:two-component system OmpR family sensor kinase